MKTAAVIVSSFLFFGAAEPVLAGPSSASSEITKATTLLSDIPSSAVRVEVENLLHFARDAANSQDHWHAYQYASRALDIARQHAVQPQDRMMQTAGR